MNQSITFKCDRFNIINLRVVKKNVLNWLQLTVSNISEIKVPFLE